VDRISHSVGRGRDCWLGLTFYQLSANPATAFSLARARSQHGLLYHSSGLLGVSGLSDDMKALLASERPHAAEAVDLFVYRIGRELGSLAAALGGIDALVFTAGIGEHAAEIRRRVCERAAWLGFEIDAAANDAGGPKITKDGNGPSAWIIPTDEDLTIARHAWTILFSHSADHRAPTE
jgi:acetate kinase